MAARPPKSAIAWHALEETAVFAAQHTTENGLDAAEAARRLTQQGQNILPEAPVESVLVLFLRQFKSSLIYVLLGASGIMFLIGDAADGLIILAVLLFNAVVGAFQEGRAQNTLKALKNYVETTATVVRGAEEIVIPDREVVEGDVILLSEGERVPADARLIAVNGLKADESSLTGESEPVTKRTEAVAGTSVPTAEQRCMVFKGTAIVVGSGKAVVVRTGSRTVIGAIAAELSTIDTEIPLRKDIRNLSRLILVVAGAICAAIFVLGLIAGDSPATLFATVVSLAVSIIPEGLPIVITLVLATGVWRMSKRHALVKKLQAVEALGQAQVIAVDKTGTITKNELVVKTVWAAGQTFTVEGIGYEPTGAVELAGVAVDAANHPELLLAAKTAALSSLSRLSFVETENRWRISGDPTEAAMHVFAQKIGFVREDLEHESPLLSEMLFDYRLKYHAAVHLAEGHPLLSVGGAPEAVLALSTKVRRDGKDEELHKKDRDEIETAIAHLSSHGLRVVALAERERVSADSMPDSVHSLTFVGLLGMQDVLRPQVAAAMRSAEAAGMKVVMITGDHQLTARALAEEAGIWHKGDSVLTGPEVDALTDAALAAAVGHVTVFARVTPEHKLRIVNAYKRRGEIIAMTGDGVNDAPSLVAADLGVAMGITGTEVAKEAADIVLLDDDFGSIVSAIEEGRSIYRTIQKVILYLFSTSLGEALVISGALLLGLPLPLLAAQIIWLNFVTDGFLDVSLAMEPKEQGLLSGTFKRPGRFFVGGVMARRMVLMALTMMIGTLWLFSQYAATDLAKALTISLTLLAVFQWLNAWNCRSATQSLFRMNPFSNRYLIGATAIVVFLQLLAVYNPAVQQVLHTVPLTLNEWGLIGAVASSIVIVDELHKALLRRRKGERQK